ncbi:MAG TPA: hypothetical protein VFN34_10300 [Ornithinibacter sp.]|nr:hypothetical protein [Ornithinibacter sp.]
MTDYEVRLSGAVPHGTLELDPALQLLDAPTTILRGQVRDDAALHGLLNRLQALHVSVLSVKRLTSGRRPSRSPIPVEVVLGGVLGEAGVSFIAESLSDETVATQLTIRSGLDTTQVVGRLATTGVHVESIWVEGEHDKARPATGMP